MNSYTCFPYSYGDGGGSITVSTRELKIGIILCLILSSLIIKPSLSNAINTTTILNSVSEVADKVDVSSVTGGGLMRVKALCIVSGLCIYHASKAAINKEPATAITFVCGAAATICLASKG